MIVRRVVWGGLIALGLLIVAWATLVAREFASGAAPAAAERFVATAAQIERGEYLARVGNCAGCHTARGGEPYAGGRAVDTPFGAVYASNLTPDRETGIGEWSAEAFYRAMHEGRSRDGRMLYPAFPYPNFTVVNRDDSDALYAYLAQRVKPVKRANTAHSLSFPYDSRIALAVWRLLYFKPGSFAADAQQSDAWNRGAYLVQGLAHCGACHSTRNALGAPVAGHAYDGAMMPLNDWYSPSLTAVREASVSEWSLAEIAAWLQSGVSPRGAALGPMAEVVFQSTQFLAPNDATAMATYLKQLERTLGVARSEAPKKLITRRSGGSDNQRGATLYREHCAQCHGANGDGKREGASVLLPALAGNRTVLMNNTANLIRVILSGGFAPATTANPRPYGMPPFYHVLTDADIADLATYVRSAWGNDAAAVTELDLVKYRDALRSAR